MHQRVTDRVRAVLKLAAQQSQRFNHPYIGTNHVLLGLVQEGSGVAAHVLKSLQIDLRSVRREVEKRMRSWTDPVAEQRLPVSRYLAKVFEYAREESRSLNHNHLGTEHILLGMLRESDGVASQALAHLGVTIHAARDEVRHVLGSGCA